MAGWINSSGSGTGTGGGRGAGGRGLTNRRYTNATDIIHGDTRSRGRPPHYRYRPVADRPPPASSSSLSDSEHQPASFASSRHAQLPRPATSTADRSSASGTAAPPSTKEPDDKAGRNAANFECNVCFDMAAEPVVTKCGHLFCWECLYQWLHVHSHHRECPVCKGQVADDAIIPIYGRGGSAASVDHAPPRPTGARVESSRQQQQQHSFPESMMYMDAEEDEPFDFPGMMDFGFESTSFRDAVMRFTPLGFDDLGMLENQYDDEYDTDFDEVYDYQFLGFPAFATAGSELGNPSSSQPHANLINLRDNNTIGTATGVYHHQEFGYSGANSHSRGRHGRRHRTRASADYSSTDGLVRGGGSNFYRGNSASSNVSAGASSRPNGGWAERRGRSSRGSNSTGGRGTQDSRRQRTNYNC